MIEEIKIEIKEHIQHLEKIDGQNIPLKDHFEFCSMNELYQTGKYSAFKDVLEILDKYNNQEKYKWKCDICGDGFNNFHAQGFDNEIYCPLCYFKHELTQYKNAWEELLKQQKQNEINNVNVGSCLELMKELEQKHNLGGVE